jgi:hypothetical protein
MRRQQDQNNTYGLGLKFGKLTASSKMIEPTPVLFHFRAWAGTKLIISAARRGRNIVFIILQSN